MSSQIILVTGAAGFLGSQIVSQLLAKGYQVRGAARGAKVASLQEGYASYGAKFESIDIPDIAAGEFPEAFEGVFAVIHTATPFRSHETPESLVHGAIEGTLNVVRQAQKAGVKKIVATSSFAAVFNSSGSFTDKDWNPIPKEAGANSVEGAYAVGKTFAERALWEFADAHPEMDITTFCPPFLYGPFAEGFSLPTPYFEALSTSFYIYRLLTPAGAFPAFAAYIDVRDLARAHVAALTAPPEATVGRKRIVIASPHAADFKAALETIAQERPELKDRLVDVAKMPQYPFLSLPVDLKRAEDVLGVKIDSYMSWKDTILSTVDSLMALENGWKAKGLTVEIPADLMAM
ncbi:hypothetical protein HWV62_20696 [Athelia sp. TMB]|nr:hypothetical protein HWV62_20696 [Athelia sp. TMB]